MKTITLTKDQITRILEDFSSGKHLYISTCGCGCSWKTEYLSDDIPEFIEKNEYTFDIEENQIKESEEI